MPASDQEWGGAWRTARRQLGTPWGAGTQGTEGLAVGRQGGLSSGPSCRAEHKV